MARVSFVQVENLAGRKKPIAYELGDLSVFWGLNGSGKTSLLKIVHSALMCDATSLLRVPFSSAEVHISDGPWTWVRRISKSDFDDREVAFMNYGADDRDGWAIADVESPAQWRSAINLNADRIKAKDVPRGFVSRSFRHGYLPISRVSERRVRRGRHPGSAEVMDEAAFDKMFAQQIQHLWVEYNQRESLAIRHAQEAGIAEILRSVLMPTAKQKAEPKLEATEAYDLIEEFFKNQRFGSMLKLSKKAFSTSYETNQLAQRIVAEVADVQLGIEAAQEPQQRLINLIAELYSGPKRLVLEDGEVKVVADEIPIPLESLSSGEKQVLQLLLECLAAGDNTVIIDEPELSMHVDWQKNLVKNLKTVNESGQLILATHSPEVMADLPDEVIIEL